MKVNFNKIDRFVDNLKKETISKIDDGIVYTAWKDKSYPTVNVLGFTVCRFKTGDYRVNKIDALVLKKLKSFKKCLEFIEGYGKVKVFNVADLI